MNNWSQEAYSTAWNFATHYHHGQSYGGAQEGQQVNYINHIGSVAMEVIWALSTAPDADGNLAIQCALLHDTIEDTAASYDIVAAQFGKAVADGVLALTKDATLTDKTAKIDDSLARIRLQPKEVWMVKLADRIANLYHPPFYWDNEKIDSYRTEAMRIYEALHPANDALAQRLLDKIAQYQFFKRTA
jgi:(p)ppGpp synthase/HD superfamily hydrolase